jgi:hypothetical protein
VVAWVAAMAFTEQTARYIGVADWWGPHVWVERDGVRRALPACGDELIAGFRWGCRGIAARELARAILADATGSPAVAERYCRELTHAVIAELPREAFELDGEAVLEWLDGATAADRLAAGVA